MQVTSVSKSSSDRGCFEMKSDFRSLDDVLMSEVTISYFDSSETAGKFVKNSFVGNVYQ